MINLLFKLIAYKHIFDLYEFNYDCYNNDSSSARNASSDVVRDACMVFANAIVVAFESIGGTHNDVVMLSNCCLMIACLESLRNIIALSLPLMNCCPKCQ